MSDQKKRNSQIEAFKHRIMMARRYPRDPDSAPPRLCADPPRVDHLHQLLTHRTTSQLLRSHISPPIHCDLPHLRPHCLISLDFPATSTAPNTTTTAAASNPSPSTMDDVYSVANVKLIDNAASPHLHGRPKKLPDLSNDFGILRLCRYIEPSGREVGVAAAQEAHPGWERLSARVSPAAMDSVVKVFCVHTEPNFLLPWQKKEQYSSFSSGFVIGGRRVLTNAHSVEHHTQVRLKKRGSDNKYLAAVLAIGTECDIAMLTVDDEEFWQGMSPVEFGDLPTRQDAVSVVGYPAPGDTSCVTSGVVSRIEILFYAHGSTELLALQTDAAINSGNSGGPAFNDKGKCVGIAFQSFNQEGAQNIGYLISTPVIMHFIEDYEKNGGYTGFPILGVEWQKMENPDLRMAMGMRPDQKGVRIRRIDPTAPDPTAPEDEVLKPSDVILSIDGVDIANDGTVPFQHGERIGFSYLISQKYTGDDATIEVLRNSNVRKFNVKLECHRLIPTHSNGKPPSYYIVAGLVFVTVSVPYLHSKYGKDYKSKAPVELLYKLLHSMSQSPDEHVDSQEFVVVSQVLAADNDFNTGYEDTVNTQVLAFNDVPVKNLKSLATMVQRCNDEYLKFDLADGQIVVLRTEIAKAATPKILATHYIPSAMSDDLKQ